MDFLLHHFFAGTASFFAGTFFRFCCNQEDGGAVAAVIFCCLNFFPRTTPDFLLLPALCFAGTIGHFCYYRFVGFPGTTIFCYHHLFFLLELVSFFATIGSAGERRRGPH